MEKVLQSEKGISRSYVDNGRGQVLSGGMPVRQKKTELWITLMVFIAALVVRLIYIYQSTNNPTFYMPVMDAGNYHQLALDFAQRGWLSEAFLWQPFLYPFFLGLIYMLTGGSILWAKIIQGIIGALVCMLTYCLGRRVVGHMVGIIAAVMLTFYGPMIFFESKLVGAGLAAFWAVALILLLLWAQKKQKIWGFFLLGLCSGLAVLTRPTFLPFVIVGVAWLTVKVYQSCLQWWSIVRLACAWLLGILIVLLPVVFLNAKLFKGRYTFLPFSGGVNLYLGNNSNICKTLMIRPGWDWEKLMNMPREHGVEDVSQQDKFFRQLVFEYVTHQPLKFVAGIGQKALHIVSSREIPRNVDIYIFGRWSSLLGVLTWKTGGFGFPFGLILPLTAIGIILYSRRMPPVIWLFLLLHSLSVVAVFVAGRYRIEMIPVMVVVAGAGLWGLINLCRQKRWMKVGACMILAIGMVVLATLPGPFCEEKVNYEANLAHSLGIKNLQAGNITKAEQWLGQAIKLKSDYSDAYLELGNVRLEQGRVDEAYSLYGYAALLRPDNANAYYKMGMTAVLQDRLDDAVGLFKRSLELNPINGKVYVLLGLTLIRAERFDEALEHFMKALQADTDRADKAVAHLHLAIALWGEHNLNRVRRHLEQALELNPDEPQILLSLAWLKATSKLAQYRNGQKAVELAKRALQTGKMKAQTLDVLAAAHAENGDFNQAIEEAQKAMWIASNQPGLQNLVQAIAGRIELYRRQIPYRSTQPPDWMVSYFKQKR